MDISDLISLLLLSPILLATAYNDLRFMRIPNVLSLLAVALFLLSAPFIDPSELGWRIVTAGSVFGLGFIAFAFGLFGGGDVKMLSALMLFIPSQTLSVFSLGFSAAMVLGILLIVTLRATRPLPQSRWLFLQAKGKFPMGVSIALAGLMHPYLVAAVL